MLVTQDPHRTRGSLGVAERDYAIPLIGAFLRSAKLIYESHLPQLQIRARRPRQPTIGPSQALKRPAAEGPAGSRLIDAPLIQPRLDAGTNSCSSGMSTAKNLPTPGPTMERIIVRKIQPRSGVS